MGEAKHYEFGNVDMSDALQDALDSITTKKEEANVILSSASLAMSSATPFSFDVHFPNLSLAITHIFPSGIASAGTSGYRGTSSFSPGSLVIHLHLSSHTGQQQKQSEEQNQEGDKQDPPFSFLKPFSSPLISA